MKKYKYITIKQVDNELFEGKPLYKIFNNRTGDQLGFLSYYKPWKEYVFSSDIESAFNNSCLKDILDYMENIIPPLNRIKEILAQKEKEQTLFNN